VKQNHALFTSLLEYKVDLNEISKTQKSKIHASGIGLYSIQVQERECTMKKMGIIVAGIIFLFLLIGISTVKVHAACDQDCCTCCQFVDEDGDGICDLCDGCIPVPQGEDDDGDGIPNGQDDDYVPPQDGDGRQNGR